MTRTSFTALLIASILTGTSFAQWYSFEELDSRYFYDPGFGGRTGTITKEVFQSRDCISKVVDSATGVTYSFIGTDRFHPEDWTGYTAMKIDFYYTYSHPTDQVALKLEFKDSSDVTFDTLWAGDMTRDTWHALKIDFTSPLPAGYSGASRVLSSVEGIIDGETVTAYWSNFRLTDGATDTDWDGTAGGNYDWNYSADAVDIPYGEPVTINQIQSGAAAAEVHWASEENAVPYGEIQIDPISPAEDMSSVNQVRFWIRTDDTNLFFKPFFWNEDEKAGYSPTAQAVSGADTWEQLTFDVSPLHTAIDSTNITAFKIVAENTDYGTGPNSGVFYVDKIEFNDALTVNEWSIY